MTLDPITFTIVPRINGDQLLSDPDGIGAAPVDPPTNFRVTGKTTSAITLNWDQSNTGITGFYIQRDSQAEILLNGTLRSYTFVGLQQNTTYYFRLASVKGNDRSVQVNTSGTTDKEVVTPPPVIPGIPSYAERTKSVTATATGSGDGSVSRPWTLKQAMLNCQPGDIIGVAAGVYVGEKNMGQNQDAPERNVAFHPVRGGTASAPIYFVAEHLAAITTDSSKYSDIRSGMTNPYDGQAAFGIGTFAGGNIDYVHFIGFYSNRDATNNKVWIGDGPTAKYGEGSMAMLWGRGNYCSVQYCKILSNDDRAINNGPGDNDCCLRIELVTNTYIANNHFRVSGKQASVNAQGVCTYKNQYMILEHNYFEGFQDYTGLAIHIKGQTDANPLIGHRIRYNKFYNVQYCLRLHANRDQASEALRSWIYANLAIKIGALFTWTTSAGLYVFNGCRFFNNTIIQARRNSESGMYYLEGDHYKDGPQVRNIMLFNNIGSDLSNYFHGGYGASRNIQWLHDFAVMDTNCVHNNTALFRGGNSLETITWEQWSVDVPDGDDANTLYQVDPLFVNTVDYKLQSGSPCKAKGVDRLGAFGPVNAAVDMGCYPTGTETIGIVSV